MYEKLVPLFTIFYPFVFPHTFPISLALTEREIAHLLEFVPRKGLREVGESGLDYGSLTSQFHLHHLEGEESISCILFRFLELLDDVRALVDCRVKDPIGIDT